MKLSTLETIFSTLNQANVKYLVAGGLAVNIHGYQRMTADLDIVIQLNTHNITAAMTSLKALGYSPIIPVNIDDFANSDTRKTWIKTKNMQVLSLQSQQHNETTIDIFVTEPFNFDTEYNTSVSAELTPYISFNLVSIATLIKMKQQAGRAKDLDDIEHLKIIQENINEQ
jgi:hypothetical protein